MARVTWVRSARRAYLTKRGACPAVDRRHELIDRGSINWGGSPVRWIRRGGGHDAGVEYRGDDLDIVDGAGSWTYHDPVGIDRPDRYARKRRLYFCTIYRLLACRSA